MRKENHWSGLNQSLSQRQLSSFHGLLFYKHVPKKFDASEKKFKSKVAPQISRSVDEDALLKKKRIPIVKQKKQLKNSVDANEINY